MKARALRILTVILLGCPLMGFQAFSDTLSFKPTSFAINPGDELFVRGFRGELRLIPDEGQRVLSVQLTQKNPDKVPSGVKDLFDQWLVTIEREGTRIKIVINSPNSKTSWAQLLQQGGWPDFIIEIRSPSLPAQIYWRDGKITAEKWGAHLQVGLFSGNLSLTKGRGDLRVALQKGALDIKSHEGSITVEGFDFQSNIKDVKGAVKVENFSGATHLSSIDGGVSVASTAGSTKISDGHGRLDFVNGRGPLKVENYEGVVRGESGSGALSIGIKGEAQVYVKGADGEVFVDAPKSGAEVDVGTVEGRMWVPNFLNLSEYPRMKVRRGRLRGSEPGKIFVRTNTGNIRIK